MSDPQPEFLTVAQTATLLQVSHATVRRWLDEGTLPGLKISRQWRIHWPRLIATLDRAGVSGGRHAIADGDRAAASDRQN
jgi:excisionase family DNA binding protein